MEKEMAEMAKSFRDLRVWNAAHEWVLEIYKVTTRFPREELFGLTSQLRRAAVSVAANIAEGFGKRGAPDKLRFYNIAQGSLNECEYYLILAADLGYAETRSLIERQNAIGRMLTAYSRAIRQ